jgi:hypothetical protein
MTLKVEYFSEPEVILGNAVGYESGDHVKFVS